VSDALYASFYLLTAVSAIVYYRRRISSNAWDGGRPICGGMFLTRWVDMCVAL
jgi:hypothetical protein